MKAAIVLLAILGTAGCYDDDDMCYLNYYQDVTDYEINPDTQTPSGIGVDTGRGLFPVNLGALDERIANIESCVGETAAQLGQIDDREAAEWQCLWKKFGSAKKIKRQCLVIKLVQPIYSSCSDWLFIKTTKNPDPSLCEDKGVIPTPDCPCRWRTAIQDENIIITPPEETRPDIAPTVPPAPYLWELGRIMTSCNNALASPFANCLSY